MKQTFLQGLSEAERRALLASTKSERQPCGGSPSAGDDEGSHRSSRASNAHNHQQEQSLLHERLRRQQLEAQVASLQAALSEQSSVLAELRGDRDALRRQLVQSDDRAVRLKALEQENAALSAKLQAALAERKQLLSKVGSMQARIAELQQSYVSLASSCEDGLDRRDILRRSRVEGMLREAGAGGALDPELAHQPGAMERNASAKVTSMLAAVTRERDMLHQRVQELTGRLSEAVGREGAIRGAQALRNASWKRSATQAEARLASALKRVKELSDELRKRDSEARSRDRYIAQLERTVMAQHRSLQQQRRLLRDGAPVRAGQDSRRSPAAGDGDQAAPVAPPSRDGHASAVPSTAPRASPASPGVGGNVSGSVGTFLTWHDSSTVEASQERHHGAAQTCLGAQGSSMHSSPPDKAPDSPTGSGFRKFLADSLAQADVCKAADGAYPWSPPRQHSAEDRQGQGRDQDRKDARTARGLEAATGEALLAPPLDAWSPNRAASTHPDGNQALHGRSSTPPAVLHAQLSSVEASLAQLYRELEEFKDGTRQDPGLDPRPCPAPHSDSEPDGGLAQPTTRPRRRSLAHQLNMGQNEAGDCTRTGAGLPFGGSAASLPASPRLFCGYDSADEESLWEPASRLLPREESPERAFYASNNGKYGTADGEGDGFIGPHDAGYGAIASVDTEHPHSSTARGSIIAGAAALASLEASAEHPEPDVAAAGPKYRRAGNSASDTASSAGQQGMPRPAHLHSDSRSSAAAHRSARSCRGPTTSGDEAEEEPRGALPTRLLSHVLCCALGSPREAAAASVPDTAAGLQRSAAAAAGSGVATLQQLLRPVAAAGRRPASAGPPSARAAVGAMSPRVPRWKAAADVRAAGTVSKRAPAPGAAAGSPARPLQCGAAHISRSYAALSPRRASSSVETQATCSSPSSKEAVVSAGSVMRPGESRGFARAHQQRSPLRTSLDRSALRRQGTRSSGVAADRDPRCRASAPSPLRVDAQAGRSSPPDSPEALSPIATLLANLSTGSGAAPAADCQPHRTQQQESNFGQGLASLSGNAGLRSCDSACAEDERPVRGSTGDTGSGPSGSDAAGARGAGGGTMRDSEATRDDAATMAACDDVSSALEAEPSFAQPHSRPQSRGGQHIASSGQESSQARSQSSVASNSVVASQGPVPGSEWAAGSRPTLSGWLAAPQGRSDRSQQAGDSVLATARRHGSALDSAASALQRLREQRLQRHHQQAQQTPRQQTPLVSQAARQQQQPASQQARQKHDADPQTSHAKCCEAQDTGVMVLTLRGSMHGEVVVSPRQLAMGEATVLTSAGKAGDDGSSGEEAAGLTLRLEVSGPPAANAPTVAEPAQGAQRPQPLLSAECSLQALRDALRSRTTGSTAAGEGEARGQSGSSAAGAIVGAETGGTPLMAGAQEALPGPQLPWVADAGKSVGNSLHDMHGVRASSGAQRAPASQHPLMQLLGQASADLQLLNKRLKPLVGDR